MRRRVAVLFFLFASWCRSAGQTAPSQGPAITDALVGSTVTTIESLIRDKYFDTAVIPQIEQALEAGKRGGEFSKARDLGELARRVNDILSQASHDGHLFVSTVSPITGQAEGLSRAERARMSNHGVRRADVLDGNVGYVRITDFYRPSEGAGESLAQAMRLVSQSDAVILDLEDNGGGSPDTAVQLLSYFFAEAGLPLFRVVERSGEETAYATTAVAPELRDAKRPVYVLVSARTWSAGEGVAFLLQERGRATVVGQRTAGAANPAGPWPVSEYLTITIPFGRIRSAVRDGNWEGSGVKPGIETAPGEAFKAAYVKALETLMPQAKSDAARRLLEDALAKAKKMTCRGQ